MSIQFSSLPERLHRHRVERSSQIIHWHYKAGAWQAVTWKKFGEIVEALALGLEALGHQRGDRVAIISQTRSEWIDADMATQTLAGTTVGIYPTLTADQTSYILRHSQTRFCFCENFEQAEKVWSKRDELPDLEKLVLFESKRDGTGNEASAHPSGLVEAEEKDHWLSYDELFQLGRKLKKPASWPYESLGPNDSASLIYTSGTTGPPKGAVITHENIQSALLAYDSIELKDSDFGFSFLPLAHVLQRAVNYYLIYKGVPAGAYGRGIAELPEDLQEFSPTAMAAVPRVFEKIYQGILQKVDEGPKSQRVIFNWALGVGQRVVTLRAKNKAPDRILSAQYKLADRLVFKKLRDRLGGRIRIFLSGGAPISTDILEFFSAAGISILEGWGMTETFASGSMNLPGAYKFGSIGKPLSGIEMTVAEDDGELLVRGPNVFSGYFRDDSLSAEVFTEDGFFKTGDLASVDEDGFFYIIGRKKDLIITAGGKNIAPQNIESRILSSSEIEQAVVIGDRRPYLVALISVRADLSEKIETAELNGKLEKIVADVNADLPRFEQIKYFRVLPHELSEENGELTPTLKIKRNVVEEKYRHLIDEMYKAKPPGRPS